MTSCLLYCTLGPFFKGVTFYKERILPQGANSLPNRIEHFSEEDKTISPLKVYLLTLIPEVLLTILADESLIIFFFWKK